MSRGGSLVHWSLDSMCTVTLLHWCASGGLKLAHTSAMPQSGIDEQLQRQWRRDKQPTETTAANNSNLCAHGIKSQCTERRQSFSTIILSGRRFAVMHHNSTAAAAASPGHPAHPWHSRGLRLQTITASSDCASSFVAAGLQENCISATCSERRPPQPACGCDPCTICCYQVPRGLPQAGALCAAH